MNLRYDIRYHNKMIRKYRRNIWKNTLSLYIITMSTWKKYGGIDKFDKTNHMTVDSMVANYFTIRKQIIGDIDISGNLAVRTRLDVYDDASFNKDMTVSGSVDIGDNLDVSGNITTNSNLTVKDNILVYHNLYFNPDRKVFMNGTPDGIGVNTTMPISQFDITSELESVFSVKTTQPSTENVIARNGSDKGIVVKSDLSSATIDFFCDSSMISSTFPFLDASGLPQLDVQLNYNNYDARIQAINNGSLTIDASSNIQLLAETIITDNKSSILDNNSSLSVYNDKTSNVYLEDIYDNSAAYVSDGISLVSVDETSSIFMKMVSRSTTETTKGFAIVGGAFAGDTSRAMGSLGCLDDDGNYIPNQTIVSGNSNVKLKTTLGINKYVPDVDTRVLDINGPIRIDNGEITTVKTTAIECNFLSFCRDNVNYGISTGAPFTSYSDPSYIDQSYWESQIYYTSDAGMSWNNASAKVYGTTTAKPLNSGFVYDQSYAFVYGDDGTGFYTIDGGKNWLNKSFNATSTNVYSMYVAKGVGNADCRFFMAYDGIGLRYYDAKIGSTDSNYVSYDGSSGSIDINNTIYSLDISGGINVVHGYGSDIYCAGLYIYKYNATTITAIHKYIPSSILYSYNTIYAYDASYVVAAGRDIISYTLDGGSVWTDIVFTRDSGVNVDNINTIYSENGESFQSIHTYDGSNAIVVGTNSSMYYTNNGTLWKKVPDNLLNAAGNRRISYGDSDVSLNGIFCINKNSFITTRIVEDGYTTKILYNYFPNLFNRSENTVLDMCGNMNIYGDINIQDNGNITSNGTTFYLVNESVQDIYFGGDASNIEIGDNSGSTTIRHNLYVDKDLTVVDGNLYIPNKAYINVADISGLNIYEDTKIDNTLTVGNRVVIENDASITADDTSGAPLYVAGGSHFAGNVIMSNTDSLLYVNGTTRLMGDLYTANNIYIDSTNTTDQYAVQINSGNVFLNNHMDISGNLEVMGNFISRNVTRLDGNTYISGKVIYDEGVVISSENVTISDDIIYNPSIINFYVEGWDDDIEKPVSMATRAYVDASLNVKATIASPVFTGIPSAPTASIDVSSTQLATTAFVKNQYYLKSAIAESTYATIYNTDLSGIPTAPTASISTKSNQIATTEYVKNVINDIAQSIELTTLNNTWSGNNSFNNDIYIHGTRFGTIDGSSIVIGNNSLLSLTTGSNNIAIGEYNGNNTTSGSKNIAIGYQSLYNNTTGGNNVAMGTAALYNKTTGGNNAVMGTSALYNNKDGSYNIAIGYNAGYSDISGSYNSYLGTNTSTSGNYSYSTAIGCGANITANNQVVIGTLNDYLYIPSVKASTSTENGCLVVRGGIGVYGNVNVGRDIGISGTTRSTSSTTGALVVAGGVGISGNVNIGGDVDISGGNITAPTATSTDNSRIVATTAFVKTAITALLSSDNTWANTNSFSKNIYANAVVIGKYGSNNYVMGDELSNLNGGSYNTIMGPNCMTRVITGSNNIGMGNEALNNIEPGSNNIGIGIYALNESTDNDNNCAVGHYALNTTAGNNNTGFGSYAGNNNIYGVNNTYIGYNTGASSHNYSYSTAIGYSATITENNQIVLGTSGEYVSIPGTKASTSSTSGALVVSGGAGIAGNVYVGGNLYATTPDSNNNSTQVATTSYVQTAISNNAFTTTGNYTWTGTNTFSNETASTSITSGALIVSGGAGISGNVYVGGNIVANNLTMGLYGDNNIHIGRNLIMQIQDTAIQNVIVGYQALNGITSGSKNTSIGTYAGQSNSTGSYNTYVGVNTDTVGNFSNSTALGYNSTITGNNQVVLGTSTEYVSIPGTNVSTSSITGALVVSGGAGISGNVYVGGNLYATTPESSNNSTQVATTAYVQSALSGVSFSTSGNYTWTGTNTFTQTVNVQGNIVMTGNINNVAINYDGSNNFILGLYSLDDITNGYENTAVGYNVLGNCSVGHENTGLGYEALLNCTTGSYNTSIGLHSLENVVDGNNNTAVGYGALQQNISTNNTAIGAIAGQDTNGSYNTYIGYSTSNSGNYSYSTAVGQYALISGNNQVVLGTTTEYVYIPSTTVSTTTTTGALVVKGGVGITGNVYVGGNLYATTAPSDTNTTQVATTAFVQNAISGISGSSVTLSSTNTWTGVNTFSNITSITNTTVSTSITTGALVVKGGVGISGNLRVGSYLYSNSLLSKNGSSYEFAITNPNATYGITSYIQRSLATYYSGSTRTISFSGTTFASAPAVSCNVISSGGGCYTVTIQSITTTNFTCAIYLVSGSTQTLQTSTTTAINMSVMAFGESAQGV
jgi:predicted acyltransferase (DUF342 family)